jgi:cytochrome c biogenesis protein CcmG/thiol:disulfide interchange protein DsbE
MTVRVGSADPEPRRSLSARGRVVAGCAAAVVFASGLWLLWGNGGAHGPGLTRAITPGHPVSVDRPAPVFIQPFLSDPGSFSLQLHQGGVVVVNFWASTCWACRTEGPRLEALWRTYRERGVQFVGVDYRDARSAAISFARSFGTSYPSVFDPRGTVGDAYRIFGLPTTYIIAPDNRIRYVVYGKVRVGSFRTALDSVLRGTSVGQSS